MKIFFVYVLSFFFLSLLSSSISPNDPLTPVLLSLFLVLAIGAYFVVFLVYLGLRLLKYKKADHSSVDSFLSWSMAFFLSLPVAVGVAFLAYVIRNASRFMALYTAHSSLQLYVMFLYLIFYAGCVFLIPFAIWFFTQKIYVNLIPKLAITMGFILVCLASFQLGPALYEMRENYYCQVNDPINISRGDQLTNAIRAYQRDKGGYPNQLQDLVPEYLTEVPVTAQKEEFLYTRQLGEEPRDTYSCEKLEPNSKTMMGNTCYYDGYTLTFKTLSSASSTDHINGNWPVCKRFEFHGL